MTMNSNQADPPRVYATTFARPLRLAPWERDIDSRLVGLAEDVRDMGERVTNVLSRNPHDRHYAIEKLNCAFRSAARALIEELDVDGEELVLQLEHIIVRAGDR